MFSFCWHKWSKWSDPFQFGFDWYQQRYCEKCHRHDSTKCDEVSDKPQHMPRENNNT